MRMRCWKDARKESEMGYDMSGMLYGPIFQITFCVSSYRRLALTPLLSCSSFYFSYLVFFLDLFLSFFCSPKIRLLARTSSAVCICILQNRSLDFTGTLRSLNWNLKAATFAWSALHDVRASYFTFAAPPKLPSVLLLESSAERSGLFAGLSSFRFRIMLFFHTLPFDSPLLNLCTYNISTFYEIQSLYWYN